jgi:hypothetical protein
MERLVLRDAQRLTYRINTTDRGDGYRDRGNQEQNTRVAVQVEGEWYAVIWQQ